MRMPILQVAVVVVVIVIALIVVVSSIAAKVIALVALLVQVLAVVEKVAEKQLIELLVAQNFETLVFQRPQVTRLVWRIAVVAASSSTPFSCPPRNAAMSRRTAL